jgi:three-Cys-motif partner protein
VDTFFDEPLEQSKVKSQIVANYFDAWANIIISHVLKIAYVDLFAGPGYYQDDTPSTPILILKKVLKSPKIAQKLYIEFNDKKKLHIKSLEKAILELDGIERMAHPVTFSSMTITKDIAEHYNNKNLPSTLFFFDPWGYKGLTPELIGATIKDWASECILFFNYNRINMDIDNKIVNRNVNELFGEKRAYQLRVRLDRRSPYEREQKIIREFCGLLEQMGAKYTLPFCFRHRSKDQTSHYIIHASKHPKGYGLMKEIMEPYSIKDADGVPAFTFDPKGQLTLNFNRPLRELCRLLLKEFVGESLEAGKIYANHQTKTRFTKRNYKDALLLLEEEGKISVDVPVVKRPMKKGKPTMGDKRVITFL